MTSSPGPDAGQLALAVDPPPLRWLVYDQYGRLLDTYEEDNWAAAAVWGYLAVNAARRRLPPPPWATFPGHDLPGPPPPI
jgi:hypothetical protein